MRYWHRLNWLKKGQSAVVCHEFVAPGTNERTADLSEDSATGDDIVVDDDNLKDDNVCAITALTRSPALVS